MMSLLIKPLEYLPEHSGQVAIWHHQECERQGLRSSLALRRQRLELHLQQRTLPKTLVAQLAGEPAGCVSLVRYALGQSDAASPLWLANLFVVETLRNRGIGSALIDAAILYARQLAFTELWLSASDYTAFYQKRGWRIVRKTRLGGRQVNIMTISMIPVEDHCQLHPAVVE